MANSELPCPVLIVCDDVPTRVATADALARADCEPIETGDAEFALEMLKTRPEIRSLVAGVNQMGLMSGCDLVRIAAARWPHLRPMVLVGDVPPAVDLPSAARVVPRPLNIPALLETLKAGA